MTNIGTHKGWIVYRCESDGVIELWRKRGANGMSRVVTTATNYAEAMEWIEGMGKKGKKKIEQKRNSRYIDLSEYDDPAQIKIE